MLYALVGVLYFCVYLFALAAGASAWIGVAFAVAASAAWMTLVDRHYGYPWFWWTGRRINGKRWG